LAPCRDETRDPQPRHWRLPTTRRWRCDEGQMRRQCGTTRSI